MAELILLQAGRTQWSDSGRIDSAAGVALSDAGVSAIHHLAEELAVADIRVVYASQMEADWQTAEIVADHCKAKACSRENLRELDFGLWQGLLAEEVKNRYGKAYRQWRESPETARPAGGEAPAEALERVLRQVKKIVKKHKDQNVVLVLQPLVAGLLRCRLSGDGIERMWDHVNAMETITRYPLEQLKLMETES